MRSVQLAVIISLACSSVTGVRLDVLEQEDETATYEQAEDKVATYKQAEDEAATNEQDGTDQNTAFGMDLVPDSGAVIETECMFKLGHRGPQSMRRSWRNKAIRIATGGLASGVLFISGTVLVMSNIYVESYMRSGVGLLGGLVLVAGSAINGLVTVTWGAMTIYERLSFSGMHVDETAPICCCSDDEPSDNVSACNLVLIEGGPRVCPSGWTHDGSACQEYDITMYSDTKTVEGCRCENFEDCSSGALKRGHPWCKTDSDSCGRTFSFGREGRWDYCRVEDESIEIDGETIKPSPLANFVPNEPDVWNDNSLAGWKTDARRAVAWDRRDNTCVDHITTETLGLCAYTCLTEGINQTQKIKENYRQKAEYTESVVECHGFAYEFETRRCVRLPRDAVATEFTPFLPQTGTLRHFVTSLFGKKGVWVNFMLETTYREYRPLLPHQE